MDQDTNLSPSWMDDDEEDWEEIIQMEIAFERKMRRRRLITIIAVVLAVIAICYVPYQEWKGWRFEERLAVHDGGLSIHKKMDHESHPEKYVCGGEKLVTEDYDFFLRTFTYPSGAPVIVEEVGAVRKSGLMYKEVRPSTRELLYDDDNRPVFNLTVFRGNGVNYYFITHVRNLPTVHDDGSVSVNICHVSPTVNVNGQDIDLYMYSFFSYSGSIETITLDGVTVHYKECKRNEPILYLEPDDSERSTESASDEATEVTTTRREEPTENSDDETEPDNPWAQETQPTYWP